MKPINITTYFRTVAKNQKRLITTCVKLSARNSKRYRVSVKNWLAVNAILQKLQTIGSTQIIMETIQGICKQFMLTIIIRVMVATFLD